MTKILALAFLLAGPAFAATTPPSAEPQVRDPLAELVTLDRDLQASRLAAKPNKRQASLEDFREELQLSTNGHEVELDKLPLAPAEPEAPAAK